MLLFQYVPHVGHRIHYLSNLGKDYNVVHTQSDFAGHLTVLSSNRTW